MKSRFFHVLYKISIKLILFSLLPIVSASGAEFKIDLSETISKEAKQKIPDAQSKKKVAIELLKNIQQIDSEQLVRKVFKINILSTEYSNSNLIIKYEVKPDLIEVKNFIRAIGEVSKIDLVKLANLNSILGTSYTRNTEKFRLLMLENDLTSAVNVSNIEFLQRLEYENSYKLTLSLLAENGEPLKLIEIQAPQLFEEQKEKTLITAGKNLSVSLKISAQEAAKIKSIQLKFTRAEGDTNIVKVYQGLDKIKKAREALIFSPQTSEPVLSFEIAREKLLLSFYDLFYWWNLANMRNQDATAAYVEKTLLSLIQYNINIAKILEMIAFQEIIESNSPKINDSIITDFNTIFTKDNYDDVLKRKYNAKYRSDTLIGCQKYIPKDFKYDNPANSFGFDGGSQVNAIMNQLGIANNSVVLGSPDKKTRVITGFISSLTENGGIISNGKTMNDANPIQFTKNAQTVVFNPEKVTVGQSLVRIVGTYDQNSKIKLTNALGGTKIVDAANINVTCIEGMQSSDEMMQNMYKMLGIVK